MGGSAPRFLRFALCTAIACAGLVPANAVAGSFCETRTVRNYEQPLERMPPIRKVPARQKLPFGPGNISFGQQSSGPLVVGSEEVGYFLDYTRTTAHPNGKRLNWLVTAKLDRVDAEGQALESIAFRQLDGLRFPSKRTLSFPLSSRPALYRLEIVFRDRSGQRLGRYGEYMRVMRPDSESRLTLPHVAFHPGEVVAPTLVNEGTDRLSYGLAYAIEEFDGTGWSRAPLGQMFFLAIGLGSGPGVAASCWSFSVPSGATPGKYRFVVSADAYRSDSSNPEKRTLTAEFEILPAI